jgi:hypothetical protein
MSNVVGVSLPEDDHIFVRDGRGFGLAELA